METVFNDPIHDQISLPPLLVKIIDTPQFQRLRNIKQQGAACFVYPGASHNRFEHSIGTAYLAGKLVRKLQRAQPDLDIKEKDVICVEMAGLCHDLGHGPFSHMFEKFIQEKIGRKDWTHEEQTCKMIDHLIEENNLEDDLKKNDITEKDIIFLKEMIFGPLENVPDQDKWQYKGREQSKSFLYEIVSNKKNQVDVDKWDYFARDCHYLGVQNTFKHNRFIKFMKVLPVENGELQICVRDKEIYSLYEMFHTRYMLHRRACKHRVVNAIESMICDALESADPCLKIVGKGGKGCTISECIDDLVAYTNLNDSIFDMIICSLEKDMKPAKEILQRILKRQLYQNVGTFIVENKQDKKNIATKIAECGEKLTDDDLDIDQASFGYGMKKENPVDYFRFYSKEHKEGEKAYAIAKDSVSKMLPTRFQELEIRVLCKKNEMLENAREAFKKWCKKNNITPKVLTTLVPAERDGDQ